ncbi:MAG: hypothetical protein QHH06_13840 [Clostridiales bacterium]|nr:cell wall-active antibiotics response protein [Eubacteriales bacterium]MDH7567524.1 hypothetical protein [Clostridiales bacterium]
MVLNSEVPVILRASSAFGSVELPDGSSSSFNTRLYKMGDFDSADSCLEIEASAVFGGMRILTA